MKPLRARNRWDYCRLVLELLEKRETPSASGPPSAQLAEGYGNLPLLFEANQGQTDAQARFISRGDGYALFLTPTEAVLRLTAQSSSDDSPGLPDAVVRMSLVGANSNPTMVGQDQQITKSNYFVGNDPAKWRTNVPNYGKVFYDEVYPGIDLVYYGNQRQLEYDFIVAPGADPSKIVVSFQGADEMELDAAGNLILHTAGGDVVQKKPYLYQEVNGTRKEVAGEFRIQNSECAGSTDYCLLATDYSSQTTVYFQLGAYNPGLPLIIDPVLSYSTYLGGSGDDIAYSIAVDNAGSAYVAGSTSSTNFPTQNAYQPGLAAGTDAFITKLNATGTSILYSTYLGGNLVDGANAIAVDSAGNAYVTGYTYSTTFPVQNAYQSALAGDADAFAMKLNSSGSALLYSTYLGGAGFDAAQGVAVDSTGSAFVMGVTTSTNYPTQNAFQSGNAGTIDVFVTKLSAPGTALAYSTYLGGTSDDEGRDIAVDGSGSAYITGSVFSADYPTQNAYQPAMSGNSDVVVTKLNAAGTALVYSTFLGGSADEVGYAVAVDGAGSAYLTGQTKSANYPTQNAYQSAMSGASDAYITKLNATGSALSYSTFLGGSVDEIGFAIAVDGSGSAYVSGFTTSSNFPTQGTLQSFGGFIDGFAARLTPAGTALGYSTYLGGSDSEWSTAVAIDGSGNAFVAGRTMSSNFPTVNAFDSTHNGNLDGFITKIVLSVDFGDAPLPYKTLLSENGAEHNPVGPTLGANRDTELDGVHSTSASGDDIAGIDDEDGVTFGTIRAGALGATATVVVAGGSAKLDAWIDFNRDGSWGGPGEQIADSVPVTPGNNTISFDVPSWAADGTTYARFRLSTAGDLGVGGFAANGEVEDYAVTVQPPKPACGCFNGQNSLTRTLGATSVFATDVDGDGDTDVLSASYIDDNVSWYENDGSGAFIPHTISTVANGAQSVFATDVDGDGDTDVLSASSNDNKIAWYENDGSENFTAHTITTAALSARSVFATDVDGDGDTDVLSAHNNVIAWYRNDGNENFTTRIITSVLLGGSSVFAADVDGDGDTDVLSASINDDKIAWYKNDGSENFTAHPISTAADGARSVFAADVDGDGDTDILSASFSDSKIAWYENDGSQNFIHHTIDIGGFIGAISVFAADVDGDSDTDVLAAFLSDDEITWYENDGSQNFTAHTITTAANGANSVFAADVDGDGHTDVLSASDFDGKIAWYENDGNQNFIDHVIDSATYFGADSVFAADVDGDGDTDVLAANGYVNQIAWYENDGSQNFTAHTIITLAHDARSVFAADVDGDGDTDVLSASFDDDRIAWYENDGSQNFTTHIISASADGARSVFAADVDVDGDTDVLSASSLDNEIAWYENDGNENFSAHTISTAANGARSVFAADVDGDGDTDVLSASQNDDKIAWYENDGVQNFTTHTISTVADGARSVFAADVDGDGDTDVLSASFDNAKITWYENNGSQNFSAHNISTVYDVYAVFAADMDGDGDTDVLSASWPAEEIAWYENDGNENFSAHIITSNAAHARGVFAADVDGDGDLDVLSDGNVAWYENTNPLRVVNTNNAGTGSLRGAILYANTNPGLDVIEFSIGTGVQTIAPLTPLPAITDSVIIDGTTQPGFAGQPLIVLSGANIPSAEGIAINGAGSTVKGLVVNGFSTGFGIVVYSNANVIEGNYIGTNAAGTSAVPNAIGVFVLSGSNTVGGTLPGTGNLIAFNNVFGIHIDSGMGNAIRQNSIHSNGDVGIHLGSGGNNNQPAPKVVRPFVSGANTQVRVTLVSTPNTSFAIDAFSNAVCDPSGFGEGQTYLGTVNLTTNASGTGSATGVFNIVVPAGHVITATATHPTNGTSEFSKCARLMLRLPPTVDPVTPLPLPPAPPIPEPSSGRPANDLTADGSDSPFPLIPGIRWASALGSQSAEASPRHFVSTTSNSATIPQTTERETNDLVRSVDRRERIIRRLQSFDFNDTLELEISF